jgi:putative two-component system response regulator
MSRETILVVEDNNDLREALGEILKFDGYTAITASNGVDALDKMRLFTPSLILSDIAMPHMDGFAFFEAVRSRSEWMAIPFIFLTARGEREDILKSKYLGAEDYLIKPLSQEELLTAVGARLERSQQIRMATLRQAYETSLTVLANAIDVRDVYTQGHVERVIAYALTLAAELGLTGRLLDQLRLGAVLHDIGKIIIRESTLFKAGQLSETEWQELKTHAPAGAEMIRDIEYLAPITSIIRHHHERWDGQGYPDGMSGDEIPLAARIIAVADSFDTMTIHRVYHPALTPEQAHDEIIRCAGTRYDPAIVMAFQRAWQAGKISLVRNATK